MNPILPGATIGLLGGGQLGRMFAIAARKLGYRVHTFEPTPDSPSGQISDREFNYDYTDMAALLEFSKGLSVVTYEFENIPVQALDDLSNNVVLRPNRELLHISQNRQREKEFLSEHGLPVAPFRVVESQPQLEAAVAALGTPCVLKTADFGYDGKGQQKITPESDLAHVWANHGPGRGVVEAWIRYEAEVSMIIARGFNDEVSYFPLATNHHENHILAVTTAPSAFDPSVEKRAQEIAFAVAEASRLVGILAVEMFLTTSGELVINEMAPRPHNSGHFSFDACVTSQFEQQLRAVCGLPLGDTSLVSPVLMHNLLGDLWSEDGTPPPWERLLEIPNLKLHLYGKSAARPGRKMGHYCILANTLAEAQMLDQQAQAILRA